ncbi:MAG: 2,3-diphosphoglycerate-dependent phosphoglycerate mutase [Bacteroidales bacterium]|jgi:2,3-bisphosphoglycerate-dependent phosphoglycerate mutase|nr:2,3-diphosphoglycerate-dependent phosphoglycerate mutase [Bacteroidales bacterium]
MNNLILVRHGQSKWNELNLFTGWTDVDLTQNGIEEAYNAGKNLKEKGFNPQLCFTSYLKRAIKTLNIVLDAMDLDYLPIEKTWRLNEKHYGILQGKNKKAMVEEFGNEMVQKWRRGFDCPPPVLDKEEQMKQRNDPRYNSIPDNQMPYTESLKDCIERLMPFYHSCIEKELKAGKDILVVAHGNSLRGIVKHLKGISDDEIASLNIPTAIPYIFEFDDGLNLKKDYFLADQATLESAQQAVANQSKK